MERHIAKDATSGAPLVGFGISGKTCQCGYGLALYEAYNILHTCRYNSCIVGLFPYFYTSYVPFWCVKRNHLHLWKRIFHAEEPFVGAFT